MMISLKIFVLRKQMANNKFKQILELRQVILLDHNEEEVKEK